VTMTNKHFGNGVSLSKKDRQQGSAFDISIDRELLRLPTMKGEKCHDFITVFNKKTAVV
jgi:hypothetical protein